MNIILKSGNYYIYETLEWIFISKALLHFKLSYQNLQRIDHLWMSPDKTYERLYLFQFLLILRTSGDSCLSYCPTTCTVTWLAWDISRSCWYSYTNQKHRQSHIFIGRNAATKGVLSNSNRLEKGLTNNCISTCKTYQMSSSFFHNSVDYRCLILTVYTHVWLICSENTPHL